jgi:hypothetical protein
VLPMIIQHLNPSFIFTTKALLAVLIPSVNPNTCRHYKSEILATKFPGPEWDRVS